MIALPPNILILESGRRENIAGAYELDISEQQILELFALVEVNRRKGTRWLWRNPTTKQSS